MAVEPAAGDHGETVEVGDVVPIGGMSDDSYWHMEWKGREQEIALWMGNLLVWL